MAIASKKMLRHSKGVYLSIPKLYNVRDAITKTKTGVGIDGVHSNHLKFLSVYATRFLTKILNSCILHNYVPRDMLEGYIKPSVKNSMGDITDSNNYREIMISNNMFKLMEYCLLPLLQKYTNVSSFQLGYNVHTSTTIAVAISLLLKKP